MNPYLRKTHEQLEILNGMIAELERSNPSPTRDPAVQRNLDDLARRKARVAEILTDPRIWAHVAAAERPASEAGSSVRQRKQS